MLILRAKPLHQQLKPEREFRFLRPHVRPQSFADRSRDHLAGLRINPVGAFGGSVVHFSSVSYGHESGVSLLIQAEAKLLWVVKSRSGKLFRGMPLGCGIFKPEDRGRCGNQSFNGRCL